LNQTTIYCLGDFTFSETAEDEKFLSGQFEEEKEKEKEKESVSPEISMTRALDNMPFSKTSNSYFTPSDCIMLSAVMKNKFCCLSRLILHNIDAVAPSNGSQVSFEFDLLPAISRCRTLRSVSLLKGRFTESFLTGLCKEIQVENPRIQELFIESLYKPTSDMKLSLLTACNRLLSDYFNYSIPGLALLSLHGLALRDEDLDCLLLGIEVNSSLQILQLSNNLLENNGFLKVFSALKSNKKSNITTLDFTWNLISCNKVVREALDSYRPPVVLAAATTAGAAGSGSGSSGPPQRSSTMLLQVNLSYNPLRGPYHAVKENHLHLKVITPFSDRSPKDKDKSKDGGHPLRSDNTDGEDGRRKSKSVLNLRSKSLSSRLFK
jgi:hypothetical protein